MALSMHFGKEVNTPEMKSILTTLTASGHQTAKKIKVNLLQLFIIADLTGSELTYAFAKKVFTENFGMPFGGEKQCF